MQVGSNKESNNMMLWQIREKLDITIDLFHKGLTDYYHGLAAVAIIFIYYYCS